MSSAATVEKKKTGPKPTKRGPRADLVAIRCFADWKIWVAEFARHKRITPSYLIDQALARMAEADGFPLPPER